MASSSVSSSPAATTANQSSTPGSSTPTSHLLTSNSTTPQSTQRAPGGGLMGLLLESGGRWPRSTPKQPSASAAEELSNNSRGSPISRYAANSTGEVRVGGLAGAPMTREENPDGRKMLSNSQMRVHRILTEEEIARGQHTRWTEMEVHGRIKSISMHLLQMRFLTALFMSGNLLTKIPQEISQLCNLTLLDLSHNKLRSLPAEIGDMISLCHLYLNSNQIRVLPYELGKLFRLQTFHLHQNPLSPDISKIYHEMNGDKKLLQHLLDHLAINTAPPPERQWLTIRHVDPDKPIATFTVLCYNVLCDKYATVNLYSYTPQWALNWEYRKQYIIKEICHYDADIVTLQEVETEQFRLLFEPKLEAVGYQGRFFPKSRSRTMNDEDKKYVDGCAIFWKTEKFELERIELIEFASVAVAQAEGSRKNSASEAKAHENLINRVMPRDNIALAAVLRLKEALYGSHLQGHRLNLQPGESVVGNVLMVCTAHIHWDPEFCDVKLIQSMMLVHELSKILERVGTKYHLSVAQIPVLICGDFNSLTDSGVYEFLSRGAIAKDHCDLKSFARDPCLNLLSANPDNPNNYNHSLRLDSAIDLTQMPWTNYTLEFRGMIDYIFATPQSLARLGILGALDAHWVSSNKFVGFPQPHVPSDHIPIMAQYAVVPTSFQRPPPPIQAGGSTTQQGHHPQLPHAHSGHFGGGGFGPIGGRMM